MSLLFWIFRLVSPYSLLSNSMGVDLSIVPQCLIASFAVLEYIVITRGTLYPIRRRYAVRHVFGRSDFDNGGEVVARLIQFITMATLELGNVISIHH